MSSAPLVVKKVRYVTVSGITPAALRAYNYDHEIVVEAPQENGKVAAVLRVASAKDVDYLARYQADRFLSGMYGSQVFLSLGAAVRRLRDFGFIGLPSTEHDPAEPPITTEPTEEVTDG